MGFFKPVHDEYSENCFAVYLLHLCICCGMGDDATLPEVKSALEQHRMAYPGFFSHSDFGKQAVTMKRALYHDRSRIARKAESRDWSEEELAKLAERGHKMLIFPCAGDSYADSVVRRKFELLEQRAVLEVCSELEIDIFNEAG